MSVTRFRRHHPQVPPGTPSNDDKNAHDRALAEHLARLLTTVQPRSLVLWACLDAARATAMMMNRDPVRAVAPLREEVVAPIQAQGRRAMRRYDRACERLNRIFATMQTADGMLKREMDLMTGLFEAALLGIVVNFDRTAAAENATVTRRKIRTMLAPFGPAARFYGYAMVRNAIEVAVAGIGPKDPNWPGPHPARFL